MFINASKAVRSGTPEHPTPRILIERMVTELVDSKRWSWVTFETKPMKHFVEVALESDDQLVINVAYGFTEDYRVLFARQGITIPDGWRVSEFKPKCLIRAGTMLLSTGVGDVNRVGEFVEQLFTALYGEQPNYHLSGVYQS